MPGMTPKVPIMGYIKYQFISGCCPGALITSIILYLPRLSIITDNLLKLSGCLSKSLWNSIIKVSVKNMLEWGINGNRL